MSLEKILSADNQDYDEIDPGTGLTKRERLIIQNTWNTVCSVGKAKVGIDIFYL